VPHRWPYVEGCYPTMPQSWAPWASREAGCATTALWSAAHSAAIGEARQPAPAYWMISEWAGESSMKPHCGPEPLPGLADLPPGTYRDVDIDRRQHPLDRLLRDLHREGPLTAELSIRRLPEDGTAGPR